MILQLIFHKLKFFIQELKNPWKILTLLLFIFTALIYGLLLGQLSNKLEAGAINIISSDSFFNYLLVSIAGLTIIRMFFPIYNPLKLLFPQYYPISKRKKYLASLITDFQKTYFLYISIFILSYIYYDKQSGLYFLITSLIVLIDAHLIRRFLQYLIDFKTKKGCIFFQALGFLVILSFFIAVFQLNMNFLILLVLLMGGLILIGYFQESLIISISHREIISKSSKLSVTIKLLLNNKKARLPLIVGLIFKSAILLGDFFLFRTSGKHLLEGQIVFWLFASPLIFFTYVFNNIWVFWKNIWLNVELRSGQYKSLIWLGLRLMFVPLIIDTIVTIPILLFSYEDYRFILFFYFTSSAYLIMLSFLWSLITPRKLMSVFQMKGSTSPASIIAAVSGVFLLTTIKINHWFYIFIPLLVLIGFIGLWLSIDMYKQKKYIITNKLMKE